MARAIEHAQAGRLGAAIEGLERLLRRWPDERPARYNLALFLLMSGRCAEALPHLDRLLAARPGDPAATFSKARGLMALDRAAEAIDLLVPLTQCGDPEVLLALGNAQRMEGRLSEAEATFRHLATRAPGVVGGHLNLGLLLLGRDPAQAAEALERALRLHSGRAELHTLLGQALLRLGRIEAAIERLDRAIALSPAIGPAHGHLLRALREAADWDREEALFARIRESLATPRSGALTLATQDALFFGFAGEELRRVAEAEATFRVPAAPPRPTLPATAAGPAPLVVGYLSPDFRDHPTLHLAGDLFAAHDRARVRPIAFSVGPDDGSEWRARVRGDCDGFHDLAPLSDAQAAETIAAAGVNLLVDMSVYTRHARPGIAARRPAPLVIQWLGLAASSGAPWIDYALVDPVLVPPAHRPHFSEALIHLPHGYQPNLAWALPPEPPARAALGLPEDAMVFCSFNGHRKLDRASFALWLRVLAAVPGSVLWQLAPPDAARQRLEAAAGAAGIGSDRLIWAPRRPRDAHLARLPAADLFLDALVCGAHTTAADALRMGVPLLTCAGERLAARVAASLLSAIGLPELICADPDAFVGQAVALAGDGTARTQLRARLLERLANAVPFDPNAFARDLESAYEQAWARWASGEAPADFIVKS
jgi:predicted O-linked N-acetylglucosamine transferase (SPINDLY family)